VHERGRACMGFSLRPKVLVRSQEPHCYLRDHIFSVLGITVSGPAIRAAKNPSSCSTFIALPPFRKSPRRSSSASVSRSFWVKGFNDVFGHSSINVLR
jgi:hypothetical protein